MRVLMAVSHIFCPEIKNGDRNKSGFSYMARSIADELGQHCDLFVITQSNFLNTEKHVDNFIMCKKSITNVLFSFSVPYFVEAIKYIKANRYKLNKALRVLLYFQTGAYCEKMIKQSKPDVIFIHEEQGYTTPFFLAAARTKIKVFITVHGLSCLNKDVVDVTDFQVSCEKELFSLCNDNNVDISVISSGMKNRMQQLLKKDLKNVQVISNYCGEDIERSARLDECTKKCDKKIVVCIGSVYRLKNQKQLIEAVELYNNRYDEKIILRIIGDGEDLESLIKYKEKKNLTCIELYGRLSHQEICKHYNEASLVAMVSINEGFGLPVLEGYWFGVPAIMFDDLDAFNDLYSKDTMIPIAERSAEGICLAMHHALQREWDYRKIKAFAETFSKKEIGKRYYKALANADDTFPNQYFYKIYQSNI